MNPPTAQRIVWPFIIASHYALAPMRPLAVLVVLLALPGCSLLLPGSGSDGVVCTLEFRAVEVEVVDTDGAPVGSLTATVRNLRTDEFLAFDDVTLGPRGTEGRYLVATDTHHERLSTHGDRLAFRAEGAGYVAEAEFVVAGGPCHIEKVSGPAQIVARPD